MAAVEISKETLWLRKLVETFGIMQNSVRVHCDSQSVIHLVKDHMYHKRMKHSDVRLLAQRPITLVLMMINSCSYVY